MRNLSDFHFLSNAPYGLGYRYDLLTSWAVGSATLTEDLRKPKPKIPNP